MNKNLLTEVNRYREIMGLSILNEALVPTELLQSLAKAFSKTEDEFLESLGKGEMMAIERVFNDVASISGKRADDLIEQFKYGNLSDDIEDLFVAKMLESGSASIIDAAVKSYAKTKPELISIINNTFKGIDSMISKASDESYTEYRKSVEQVIDYSNLTPETKKYLKNEFIARATEIRSKITPVITTPPSIDEVWSTAEKFAKSKGKELPPKEYFLTLEDEIVKSGITKKELIDIILKEAKDKKSMIEYLKQGRAAGSEVGGALVDAGEKTFGLTKKALAGWTFGGIALLGLIGFGFNVGGLRDTILHGSKSSTWKEVYKENFYELPEDIQNTIVTNYEGKASNDPNKSDSIKSFDYNEGNEGVFKVIFRDGTIDEWNKVQTGDSEYWAKKQPTTTTTTTTTTYEQKLESFKQYLRDNKLSDVDAKNDTEASGFWQANGKNYEFVDNTFKDNGDI